MAGKRSSVINGHNVGKQLTKLFETEKTSITDTLEKNQSNIKERLQDGQTQKVWTGVMTPQIAYEGAYPYIHSYALNFNDAIQELGLIDRLDADLQVMYQYVINEIEKAVSLSQLEPTPEDIKSNLLHYFAKGEASKTLDTFKNRITTFHDKVIKQLREWGVDVQHHSKDGVRIYVFENKEYTDLEELTKAVESFLVNTLPSLQDKKNKARVNKRVIKDAAEQALNSRTKSKREGTELADSMIAMQMIRALVKQFNKILPKKLGGALENSLRYFKNIDSLSGLLKTATSSTLELHQISGHGYELGVFADVISQYGKEFSSRKKEMLVGDKYQHSGTQTDISFIFLDEAKQDINVSVKQRDVFTNSDTITLENMKHIFQNSGIDIEMCMKQLAYFLMNFTLLSEHELAHLDDRSELFQDVSITSCDNVMQMYDIINKKLGLYLYCGALLGKFIKTGIDASDVKDKLPKVLVMRKMAYYTYDILEAIARELRNPDTNKQRGIILKTPSAALTAYDELVHAKHNSYRRKFVTSYESLVTHKKTQEGLKNVRSAYAAKSLGFSLAINLAEIMNDNGFKR